MNGEGYREIKAVVEPLGYDVVPEPKEGRDIQFFDIVSEVGAISPSKVLNAIHGAVDVRAAGVIPELKTAQPYCLSFEDIAF